jgi:hypothetical protein
LKTRLRYHPDQADSDVESALQERPFACDLCKARFGKKAGLQVHKLKFHRIDYIKSEDEDWDSSSSDESYRQKAKKKKKVKKAKPFQVPSLYTGCRGSILEPFLLLLNL